MNLKRIITGVVVYGVVAVCFNYFSLPLTRHFSLGLLKNNIVNRTIQQVSKVENHLDDIVANINKDSELLSVLKSAHALSLKWLRYESVSNFWEARQALEKGEADCSYFSAFTYSNFLYLADRIGKPELKDKVRLSVGFTVDSKEKLDSAHAWLQVYLDNKWRNYEPTVDPIKKDHDLKFENLEDILPDWQVLDYEGYRHFSYLQFEEGKLVRYTNMAASLESGIDFKDLAWFLGKGWVRGIRHAFKEKIKLNRYDSSVVH